MTMSWTCWRTVPQPAGLFKLTVCVQIDVLKMGWCKIGEKDGAKAIADLILFNTSLTTLDLRGNGLGNAGEQQTSPATMHV